MRQLQWRFFYNNPSQLKQAILISNEKLLALIINFSLSGVSLMAVLNDQQQITRTLKSGLFATKRFHFSNTINCSSYCNERCQRASY